MLSQHVTGILFTAMNTDRLNLPFQETVSDSEVEEGFRNLFLKLAGNVRTDHIFSYFSNMHCAIF